MAPPAAIVFSNPLKFNTDIQNAAQAYLAGQCVGALLTVSAPQPYLVNDVGPVGIAVSILMKDLDNQKAPVDLVFFNAKPTDPGDGVAFAPSAADADKIVARLKVFSTDWQTYGTVAIANPKALGLTFGFVGKELYALVVNQGTPTYATAPALSMKLTGATA